MFTRNIFGTFNLFSLSLRRAYIKQMKYIPTATPTVMMPTGFSQKLRNKIQKDKYFPAYYMIINCWNLQIKYTIIIISHWTKQWLFVSYQQLVTQYNTPGSYAVNCAISSLMFNVFGETNTPPANDERWLHRQWTAEASNSFPGWKEFHESVFTASEKW